MYEKTILEESNVDVFNEIGEYAKGKNLNVLYFKVKMPVTATRFITSIEDMNKLELGEVDYIHLYDNKEYNLILSIYYDTKSINSMIDCPYYEVFRLGDVERFFNDEKEQMLEYAKGIIDKVAIRGV